MLIVRQLISRAPRRLIATAGAEEREKAGSAEMAGQIVQLKAVLAEQSESMEPRLAGIEAQLADLQRSTGSNGSRFGDLHKDLAGIVWELSKLRTDLARWQSLSYLAGSPGAGAGRAALTPRSRAAAADVEAGGAKP